MHIVIPDEYQDVIRSPDGQRVTVYHDAVSDPNVSRWC